MSVPEFESTSSDINAKKTLVDKGIVQVLCILTLNPVMCKKINQAMIIFT